MAASVDTGISSLVIILRVLGQPADADQMRHRYGAPERNTDATGIVRAAREQKQRGRGPLK